MITTLRTNAVALWNKFDQLSDPRTRGWPLVDSPTGAALVITAYLLIVWWGPKIMEKRKPFKLKGLLIAYNLFLVLLNIYIVTDITLGLSRRGYRIMCHRARKDFHPEEMRVVTALWWAYLSKCFDLGDSLFFILRKKPDQLSVLHIYHHATMVAYTWVAIKIYPGGAPSRGPAMNSFVHIIMYTYYALSAMGPKAQKYLWWKKYLTWIQLVQFVIVLTWSVNALVKGGCNHHISIDIFNVFYMFTFIYLFGIFYLRKYKKKVE